MNYKLINTIESLTPTQRTVFSTLIKTGGDVQAAARLCDRTPETIVKHIETAAHIFSISKAETNSTPLTALSVEQFADVTSLTVRERYLLVLRLNGYSYETIAAYLCTSYSIVRQLAVSICKKAIGSKATITGVNIFDILENDYPVKTFDYMTAFVEHLARQTGAGTHFRSVMHGDSIAAQVTLKRCFVSGETLDNVILAFCPFDSPTLWIREKGIEFTRFPFRDVHNIRVIKMKDGIDLIAFTHLVEYKIGNRTYLNDVFDFIVVEY